MFVIIHNSGLYFHNKDRIILFESQHEAQSFMEIFINYSMNELGKQNRLGETMRVPIVVMHECKIIPVDFDINTVECGAVLCRELFKDKEY